MHDDPGYTFLHVTKYPTEEMTDAARGLPPPDYLTLPGEGAEVFPLPEPSETILEPLDLRDAIRQRRSVRIFTGSPVPFPILSYLLWAMQGVSGPALMYRTAPSAGALHPVDTYAAIQNVSGVPIGIWRYLPDRHALELIEGGPEPIMQLSKACLMQPAVLRAPVTFFWAATPYRTVWKYGQRGYRDIFLDAGHICQNCYLAGVQAGLGVCAIGAFSDDAAAAALHPSKDQVLIYAAAAGYPREVQ